MFNTGAYTVMLSSCFSVAALAVQPLAFDDLTTLIDGDTPSDSAAFDVDNDGDPDFATSNRLSNDVVIFRNDGARVFVLTQTIPLGAPGIEFKPRSIESADFNHDGWLDLITANELDGSLSLFLNDGAGTILAPTQIPVGVKPTDLTITDVNDDGWLDVAVVQRGAGSQSVWVFVNNGADANGWNGFSFDQSYPIDPQGRAIIAVDINLDGFVDLITANREAGTLSILPGTATAAFMPRLTVSVGSLPRDLVAVDLDGDARVDLAVIDFSTGDVWALLNRGVANFQWLGLDPPTSIYQLGDGMHGVGSGDFDNDGIPDLAIANLLESTGVTVLHNLGGFVFSSHVYPTTECCTSSTVVADLDADGFEDIITTSAQMAGQVQILWNTTSSLIPPQADLNGDDLVNGEDLALLLIAWGQSGVPADLNNNGVVDGADLAGLLISWSP